jgi:crotonobetainyl-CoA:carnitine CoA-transferase CaiB-like acyl-CoA transferase
MLSDVVVLEIGLRESAAWCGRLLADLGATVIRASDTDTNADADFYTYLHAGKRTSKSLEPLDMTPQIVIVDGPDVEAALPLADLRHRNPALVVVSVSDFGQTGPDADTPASELTLQAEAGIVALHPTAGRPPVGAGVHLAEQVSGRCAAVGALMGLLAVEAGASGTEVDVSRFESLLFLLQFPWLFAKFPHHYSYPVPQMAVPGIEPASDGWVCVVAVSPQQWMGFKTLAAAAALEDARFDAYAERVRLVDDLRPHIRAFTRRHTVAELVDLGIKHRVPIVPVTTPQGVVDFAPFAQRRAVVESGDGRHLHPGPSHVFRTGPGRFVGLKPNASGTPEQPLRGVRVVEFGTFQAGPAVGAQLAALGADVVRVESASRPDAYRFTGSAPTVDQFWERSATFAGVNVGKRTITADMSEPAGRVIVERLIAASDVLIENYVPRVLDDRGLDYAGVRALREDIVMVRMPAWGSTGPWRDQPGFTFTANAASGLSSMTGYPDGEPLLTGSIIDPIAALVATVATLAAIRHRHHTGQGALVEVPLCDVALQLSAREIIAATAGRPPIRSANRHPHAAPQGIYRAADGRWVALSVLSDQQWRSLCSVAEGQRWATDDALRTAESRTSRHDELDEVLGAWCGRFDSQELVSRLRNAQVPTARVEIGDDAIDHPQLLARQRVFELDHPVAGRARYIGAPMKLSHDPVASAARPAPLFGQHNREVLAEIGFTPTEIDAFEAAGALAQSPFNLPFAAQAKA